MITALFVNFTQQILEQQITLTVSFHRLRI